MILELHKEVKPPVSVLQCEICLATFHTKNKLEIHKRENHTLKTPQTTKKGKNCDMCGKFYNLPSQLKCHGIMSKNGKKLYACKKCMAVYEKLTKSKKKVSDTDNEIYKCLICDKQFATEYFLNCHKKSDHSRCTNCKSAVKPENAFLPYTCEECGFENVKLENSEDSNVKQERFMCDICYEEFSREPSLIRHKSVVHWRTT